ncbi:MULTISPECIES: ATP-binding protein [Pseudomonas]|uniref:ATP-binding protein n=1 Tax=Pseudomonas TaxID=286 RepID=UPI001F2EE35A|nr:MULTISPECIES: ATP-binding protein [Pseudomonas]MCX4219843.1 ATP-binding protein [Pseudomonas sp. MCal1]UIN55148.1 ATP-binding protein [Pseudomonas kribbensis]UQS18072.1 ATP-binding protein [Pseudomonas sp. HS6]
MNDNLFTVAPDVARISEGLRDTGYDFNTAIADIIDNSIAAEANLVDVRIVVDFTGNIIISVGDDGNGMDRPALMDAMKYGSPKRPSAKSLGKFGLGLKTASTAFCRRLSVVSKFTADVDPLRATWDLDVMAARNSWDLEITSPSDSELELLNITAKNNHGTVVIWESVDRILNGYKDPTAPPLKKAVLRLVKNLQEHIALVYQRFLDPNDDRERTVNIRVNDEVVEAWDPFCIAETKEPVAFVTQDLVLPDGTKTNFIIKAFILPRKEEFSSEEAKVAARVSNERQGVYVYRENRLIHGPDWMGMFKQEPHYSLMRVELSFDHTLDTAFQVDIKKSRINLNSDLYEWLRDKILAAPRREAEIRYRRGVASTATGTAALLHASSSNVINQKSAGLTKAEVNIVDAGTGEVTVNNKSGTTTATMKIVDSTDTGSIHITTAPTLEHGALWEPSIGRGSAAAVSLNTGHPFYSKAYLPNKENSPVIQALDYLLWALAQAELNNVNNANKDAFEEFRIEVSRNLKKLVADLPDAVDGDIA